MSKLSKDIDILKKKYREIFLKTGEEFNLRIEKMTPEEFLNFLNEDALKEVFENHLKIYEIRKKSSCLGCAACCKLACSEFSPEDLAQKAIAGDNFAQQFLSVFVPYKNESDAQSIYPEYFELLREKAQGEKVYFYHCPKVTKDNRCPDYENRPQICRDFPDNPIAFLPSSCGFLSWKEESEPIALKMRAMLEIIEFYKSKLG